MHVRENIFVYNFMVITFILMLRSIYQLRLYYFLRFHYILSNSVIYKNDTDANATIPTENDPVE